MAITEFSSALNQVSTERGINPKSVLEAIEIALVAAYKKDFPVTPIDEIEAKVNEETGEAQIYKINEDQEKQNITPAGFGRIASQTAKQVILQKLRETEKETVSKDYEKKVGEIVWGHIFRMVGNTAVIDLGKTQGTLAPQDQIPKERYNINQRLKVLVKGVKQTTRGPEIIVSRSDPEFVKQLFALEVPEISSGTVKIEAVAREAGSRTKVAASSLDERIDPVGSCVGQKGVRVQNVINEIHDEKIDVIPHSPKLEKFVAASLSPAKVTDVELNESRTEALVIVPEDQLSLAIGKDGQNVRLAARLTGIKIDIKGAKKSTKESADEFESLKLPKKIIEALKESGVKDETSLLNAKRADLKKVKGVGPKTMEKILDLKKSLKGKKNETE